MDIWEEAYESIRNHKKGTCIDCGKIIKEGIHCDGCIAEILKIKVKIK